MNTSNRHRNNRKAWNEAARFYERELEESVSFLRNGGWEKPMLM